MAKSRQIIFFLFLFIFSFIIQLYAEDHSMLSVKSGDLVCYIDPSMARFSIIDPFQSNADLISLLFGGTKAASSYIRVFIDGQSQTFDEMKILYPLGESIGSQVDGIFLAGSQQDICVEVAFFAMDIQGKSMFNTIGVALKVSNISQSQLHNVGIKIMLDTDIGENHNDPLIYLPSGRKLTQAELIDRNSVPPYFFLGNKKMAVNPAQGDGFYIYPLLSDNVPDKISVANWKSLSDARWITEFDNKDFNYDVYKSKDAGIAVYFGQDRLPPQTSKKMGIALSKHLTSLCPLIDEQTLEKGVFSPFRFEVEEMIYDPLKNLPGRISPHNSNSVLFGSDNQKNDERSFYRRQILNLDNIPEKTKNQRKICNNNSFENDTQFGYSLSQINSQMISLDEILNKNLEKQQIVEILDSPPNIGVYMK